MKKLVIMWLNLQNFLIFYNDDPGNLVNAVIAFGHKAKGVVVVRPEFHSVLDDIKVLLKGNSLLSGENFKYLWGDGFFVDTWNNVVRDYKEEGPDFTLIYDPSVPMLVPNTKSAVAWVKENVFLDSWQNESRIAIEPRCVDDILMGISETGMTVEKG